MSLSTAEVVVDYLKAFNFYLDEGMVDTRDELDLAVSCEENGKHGKMHVTRTFHFKRAISHPFDCFFCEMERRTMGDGKKENTPFRYYCSICNVIFAYNGKPENAEKHALLHVNTVDVMLAGDGAT